MSTQDQNTPLWTIDAMANAMSAEIHGSPQSDVTGISIDTRTLEPGNAYFAIKGDVHDGHAFVANAAKEGAAVSVVSRDKLDELEGDTGALLVVDDVLKALENLGRASRARCDGKIIAVTGSVGKTTTKEAMRKAFGACGRTHAAVASFNNHWGVPLTLARMPQDTEFGIFEIGMNHPDEITPLVKMVQPHVAIITNVAAVHLGAFDSVDGIAKAKAEIFAGLDDSGTAVLNADDERFSLLTDFADGYGVKSIVSFGEAESGDCRLLDLVERADCSTLKADVMGEAMMVRIGAPGRHIAQNCLAVLAAVKLADADLAKAGLALGDMEAVKGRGQRHVLQVSGGTATLIDESYNANPTSMRAALALLGKAETGLRGRRIAVMGDMLELGPTSRELHAGLLEPVLDHEIDHIFIAGEEMTALEAAAAGKVSAVHGNTIDDIIPQIASSLRDGDVIMAKASLGMKFARLIDHLLKTEEH